MEPKAVVNLRKGEGRTIKAGGLWIFDNEIESVMGSVEDGDIVIVRDFDGYPMGRGFINRKSKITVRMLTRDAEQDINEAFLRMRVKNAWEYRKAVMQGDDLTCCRVMDNQVYLFDEPSASLDHHSIGLLKKCIAELKRKGKIVIIAEHRLYYLKEIMAQDGVKIRGVYERSDAKVRKKEGLAPYKGCIGAEFEPVVEIVENGVHYKVDVANGQKTGFFLDQKYNRLAMQRLIKGLTRGMQETPLRVLDCFTHMGTFALNCGYAGASDVLGLDISEFAVEQARENAKLNHLEKTVHFKEANVLDELPKLAEAGEQFDVVILDPPAFTKSREATKNAIKGYREINRKGLQLVKNGGYFATISSSHFMTQELLAKTVKEAAKATHKRLRQVEFRTQAPDHPILWAADESYYLKFYIFQVVEEK